MIIRINIIYIINDRAKMPGEGRAGQQGRGWGETSGLAEGRKVGKGLKTRSVGGLRGERRPESTGGRGGVSKGWVGAGHPGGT